MESGRARWDREFDDFATSQGAWVLRTAAFLSGDQQLAEDLAQTALLRTALRWRQASANPHAYVRQVLVNLVRDGWRHRARRPAEVPLDGATAHVRLVRSPQSAVDDREELLDALRALPARQRTAVVLRFWEDLTIEQAALLMGCSQGTVKSATSRGLNRLHHLLSAAGHAEHRLTTP